MKTNKAADACQIHTATVTQCLLPTSRRWNSQYHSINQIGIKILLLGQQSRVYTDSASDNNLSFPALSYHFRQMLHRLPVLSPSSPYLPVYRFSPCWILLRHYNFHFSLPLHCGLPLLLLPSGAQISIRLGHLLLPHVTHVHTSRTCYFPFFTQLSDQRRFLTIKIAIRILQVVSCRRLKNEDGRTTAMIDFRTMGLQIDTWIQDLLNKKKN